MIKPVDETHFSLTKREFTIDTFQERINVEGHTHKNVALKYLMKRRRSLLMTKDPNKLENLFSRLPQTIRVIGKQITRNYAIRWEKEGTTEFQGSRFVFDLQESELS